MEKLIVNVTQDDINRGLRCRSRFCPIALSLGRAGRIGVEVGPSWASFLGGRGKLNRRAISFIEKFDLGEPVKPFKFILEVENV